MKAELESIRSLFCQEMHIQNDPKVGSLAAFQLDESLGDESALPRLPSARGGDGGGAHRRAQPQRLRAVHEYGRSRSLPRSRAAEHAPLREARQRRRRGDRQPREVRSARPFSLDRNRCSPTPPYGSPFPLSVAGRDHFETGAAGEAARRVAPEQRGGALARSRFAARCSAAAAASPRRALRGERAAPRAPRRPGERAGPRRRALRGPQRAARGAGAARRPARAAGRQSRQSGRRRGAFSFFLSQADLADSERVRQQQHQQLLLLGARPSVGETGETGETGSAREEMLRVGEGAGSEA